jgi:hypothetical protein
MDQDMSYRHSLLCAVVLPLLSAAQGWFPDGAVWYNLYAYGTYGCVRTTVAGDTVIDGQPCRKLERVRDYYNVETLELEMTDLPSLFVHAHQGLVWVYAPTIAAFDTLYDFNAQPGDHWCFPPVPYPLICAPESRVVVTGTGIDMNNGIPLTYLEVELHSHVLDGSLQVDTDIITERMGPYLSYLLPGDHCNGFLYYNEAGPLLGYFDSEISAGMPNRYCEMPSAVPTSGMVQGHRVWPNPGSDRVFLTALGDDVPLTIRLLDAQGRCVLAQQGVDPSAGLDVSGLPPGLYTVLHSTGGAWRSPLKWIKE